MSPARPALFAILSAAAVVLAPSCAGCSEECSGATQGAPEGCPCGVDQDCATRVGEVMLCLEGACTPADPPDAPAEECDVDADCGDGELCGLGMCSPAPKCQRIDVGSLNLRELQDDGVFQAAQAATVTRDGCGHEIEGGPFSFSMSDVSPKNGAADVDGDCDTGRWFAAMRAGVFQCGTDIVVLSVLDACLVSFPAGCAGTCVSIGSDLDEDLGVCR